MSNRNFQVKKYIHRVFFIFIIGMLLMNLNGCSGNGDENVINGNEPVIEESLNSIQGYVLAPSGQVASFNHQSTFANVFKFIIPDVIAELLGLSPVSNALVELIYIDNNGYQTGEVLALATTNNAGEYIIDLPADVNLASNLIVRVTASNIQMRAQAVSENVNIDPISEFVVESLISSGIELDNLGLDEVKKLREEVEKFEIYAVYDPNIQMTLERLSEKVGAHLAELIEVLGAEKIDPGMIEGDYHNMMHYYYTTYPTAITNTNNNQYYQGIISSVIDMGSKSISVYNGEAESQGQEEKDSYLHLNASSFDATIHEYYADLGISNEDGGQTKNSNINLYNDGRMVESFRMVDVPEPNHGTGFRILPYTLILYPTGTDSYIGCYEFPAESYGLKDDNSLDIDNQIDYSAASGINFLARKSDGLNYNSVAGKYGLVSLETGFTNLGERRIVGVLIDWNFESNGTISAIVNYSRAIASNANSPCQGFLLSFDEEIQIDANGTYTLSEDGGFESSFGLGPPPDQAIYPVDGFFAENGKIFIGRGTQKTDDGGAQFPAIGIRLPEDDTIVDIGERRYKLFGQRVAFTQNGMTSFSKGLGTITFGSDDTCKLVIGFSSFEKETDCSDYSLGGFSEGGTYFYESKPGGGLAISYENLEGYVAYDGSIIIFTTAWLREAKDAGGLWIIGIEDRDFYTPPSAYPWQKEDYKVIMKRYPETDPNNSWQVTSTNLGTTRIHGEDFVVFEKYNYSNSGEKDIFTAPKSFFTPEHIGKIGEFKYEIEIENNVNGHNIWVKRRYLEKEEIKIMNMGTFMAFKRTNMAAEYVEGLPLEDHDFPETQKWINWFYPDYLFLKEFDYWTGGTPEIQKLVSVALFRNISINQYDFHGYPGTAYHANITLNDFDFSTHFLYTEVRNNQNVAGACQYDSDPGSIIEIPINIDAIQGDNYRLKVSRVSRVGGWSDPSTISVNTQENIVIIRNLSINQYDFQGYPGTNYHANITLNDFDFSTHFLYTELRNTQNIAGARQYDSDPGSIIEIPINIDAIQGDNYRLKVSMVSREGGWSDPSTISVNTQENIVIVRNIGINQYDFQGYAGTTYHAIITLNDFDFSTHFLYIELRNTQNIAGARQYDSDPGSVIEIPINIDAIEGDNYRLKVSMVSREGGWSDPSTISVNTEENIVIMQ